MRAINAHADVIEEHKSELVRYDAMCRAIAECRAIDEVKEIRDRALALEVYAAQALNMEAERQAIQIRLRAERRAGQMLCEQTKNRGGDRKSKSPDATLIPTLPELGVSRDQSSEWQQLAEVPEGKFEDALADRNSMPSREKILAANKPRGESPNTLKPGQKPVPAKSIWIWGRIKDFEREKIFEEDLGALFEGMTLAMQADIRKLTPRLIAFLVQLSEVAQPKAESLFGDLRKLNYPD